jgi:hypothetical protein
MEGKGVKERDWVMMSVINLSAIPEYGKASGRAWPMRGTERWQSGLQGCAQKGYNNRLR